MNPTWPPARVDELRRMVKDGKQDPEIAEALGVTVRAVIGKRHREGILRITNRQDAYEAAILRKDRKHAAERRHE